MVILGSRLSCYWLILRKNICGIFVCFLNLFIGVIRRLRNKGGRVWL